MMETLHRYLFQILGTWEGSELEVDMNQGQGRAAVRQQRLQDQHTPALLRKLTAAEPCPVGVNEEGRDLNREQTAEKLGTGPAMS
jgi:hypothetical protein